MGRLQAGPVDELLGIGEFSRRCGLSPKVLRTYAANGLLTPAAVDRASGYRYYAPGQIDDAHVIGLLRRAGVALIEIAGFLRQPTRSRLDAWVQLLDDELRVRREALAEVADLLVLDVVPPAQQHRLVGAGGSSMIRVNVSGASQTGPVRPTNQDVVLVEGPVMAVADGMGGHKGGEVAARTAVDALNATWTPGSMEGLTAAVSSANRAVFDQARRDRGLEGMGTTICAAGLVEVDGANKLGIVYVGDSRAYLLHDGKLSRLTEDHTLVAELVRQGELTASGARSHPDRGILTRALGIGPDVDADSLVVAVVPGDRVLLCTDGLVNELDDTNIRAVLASLADAQAAADELVRKAIEAGGNDNVSVVVIDVARL
jgi:protein phosphatase